MNFCPKCRKRLIVQDFCVECGADLKEFLNNDSSSDSSGSFDFSALDNAKEQLIEQSGLVIENGVLTGYNGKKTIVYIPSAVEEIFDRAFCGNNFITEVTIENGPSVIGKSAFAGCQYLKKVKIPRSVKRIGEYAFYSTYLDELLLDDYNEEFIKSCLSANALNYLNTGVSLGIFTRNENGTIKADIKSVEAKAVEYANECRRKEEEERRRRDEEIRRQLEEQRKAEEKRRAEEEAKRKAEAEEARKRAQKEAEERQRKEKEAARKAIIDSWQLGGQPVFGKYHYSEIYWIVVERQGNRALIVSLNGLEKMNFHNTEHEYYSWDVSDIRKWLNNDFINGFSMSEREKILSANGDRAFLLSVDEARRYFRTDNERSCTCRYCGKMAWWLRTPGTGYDKYGWGYGIAVVDKTGRIAEGGCSPDRSYRSNRFGISPFEVAVRPAMWVDVDKIIAEL